jgi:UDP-glucose 4-epimerase
VARALITGGAGFIGSHLAEALLRAGRQVTVVDDLSTGRIENLAGLLGKPGVQFVRDSVRNMQTMTALVDRCDVIYHLAAAVGVQLIVDQPVHTLETNIHGSEVVLHLASKFGRRVLLASTSEVYGKSAKDQFAEDDDVLLGSTQYTRWSYAASKMVDEFLALAYREQYGLQTVICRFFNTVGPRQTGQYGMVVPRFVRRALAGEPIEVYGTGEQSRCFCHVRDVVDALPKLMDCDAALGQVVNVGSDEAVTINGLARKILERTGSASPVVRRDYAEVFGRPFDDIQVRRPDLNKIHGLIGYRPTYTLDETLQDIIDHERSGDSDRIEE